MKYLLLILLITLLGCADKNPYPEWNNIFDPANQIASPFLEADTMVKIGSIVRLTAPDSIAEKNVTRTWIIPRDTTTGTPLDTLEFINVDTTDNATNVVGTYIYELKLNYDFGNIDRILYELDTMIVQVLDTIPHKRYPLDSLQEGIQLEDKIGFYQARLRWERTYPDTTVTYRIRYGVSNDLLDLQVYPLTIPSYDLSNLTINTVYYWNVEAVVNIAGVETIIKDNTVANFRTNSPEGMVLIPSGTFTMGSDSIGDFDEKPQHQVTISDFWMDTTEVTVAKYHEITGEDIPVKDTTCLQCPKATINWYEAVHYANLMSNKYGADTVYTYEAIVDEYNRPSENKKFTNLIIHDSVAGFRLPTEAEWEFAAKGKTTTPYYWIGDTTTINQYVNYNNDSTGAIVVASLGRNVYGLYDMLGNVWEWVQDSYDSTAYTNQEGAINPLGPGTYSDSLGVIRGCSFNENKNTSCTVYERQSLNKIHDASKYTGFRLVFNIPD